jgi:hypothetical protein
MKLVLLCLGPLFPFFFYIFVTPTNLFHLFSFYKLINIVYFDKQIPQYIIIFFFFLIKNNNSLNHLSLFGEFQLQAKSVQWLIFMIEQHSRCVVSMKMSH